MNTDLQFQIALTQIKDIGPVLAKQLVSYCSGVEEIFKAKKTALEKIPNIGEARATAILEGKDEAMKIAEKELKFIEKHHLQPIWYLDKTYPQRLLNCNDSPLLMYFRGAADFNQRKIIAIVGTRKMSDYGKMLCEKLMEDLSPYSPLIVSGLAYGVDIAAHRAALKNNLDTIAVVANGMDKMYPTAHLKTAKEMTEQGGILTEYISGTEAERENFPSRNRIVAGMSDATILIETAVKGGAMITAALANGYNRDVFAFPGEVNKTYSQGCNHLIKTNQAHLIENAKDVIELLNWDEQPKHKKPVQKELFVTLNETEQKIWEVLKEKTTIDIDTLCHITQLSNTAAASALLMMELNGLVQALPGKIFKMGY